MPSEFLVVAEQILQNERRPMRPGELVDHAFRNKLFTDRIAGRTPHQTMKSKLCVDVRRKATNSIFVRTSPGKFFLRRLLDDSYKPYDATPQHKPRAKEKVLVFPSTWLDVRNRFQGITLASKRLQRQLLRPDVCSYRDRLSAEQDNQFKQVLTYVMLTRKNSVLAFKRGSHNRVEDFLRGSHCIGFGGHVSEVDRDLFSVRDLGVEESAVREVGEELTLPDADRRRLLYRTGLQLVGLLNDDSSLVGQRHFAFVYRYEVSSDPSWDNPQRGEKSITQLRWLSPDSKPVAIWDFEYWPQLCLRRFFHPLVHSAPAYRIRRKASLRPPHLLCLLGAVGSGKSEAGRVLKDEFGYKEINTGRIIAKLLGVAAVPKTPRAQFQELAWDFIQKPGACDQLALAIHNRAKRMRTDRVVIDGIRQRETIERLKTHAESSVQPGLLYVHTLPDLAYNFYKERESRGVSIFDFMAVRDAPVETEVEQLIGLSDAVLYNWAGRNEYRQAVRALVRELLT
jgi:predicted NUDIX family phosphoesterase